MTAIEVCFGPAEFAGLRQRDLRDAACVVFDVLRATTTAIVALANGARAIRPVPTLAAALAEREADSRVLLAGERGGLRIGAELTGGVEFDFGNSPREFLPAAVDGRTLVMTTTNGTRALEASAQAGLVVAGAWVNLSAVVRRVKQSGKGRVVLVASGTGEETAWEDVLACGAFVSRWVGERSEGTEDVLACGAFVSRWVGEGIEGTEGVDLADSARVAWAAWQAVAADPERAAREARNARRLASLPELAEDLSLCLTMDRWEVVPVLCEGRELRLDRGAAVETGGSGGRGWPSVA